MRKIVISLIGLNLVLVAYLVVALQQHATQDTLAVASTSPPEIADAVASQPVAPSEPPQTVASPTPINWASLASPNLRKYAQNLRDVGCPEETIKEIMLAEVNRLYGPQERALRVRPDDVAPWETAALYDRRLNETRLRQLLEDKRNLLKDLTGVDVGIDMPSRLAGRDLGKFEGAFASIPDAKREQVRAIQENYWAQSDDIKQRTLGYLEPEDRQEFLRIKTERRDALANVLAPDELQEYELKTSETASTLRSRLGGFKVSEEEFRRIFDFLQPLDEQYSLGRRNPDPLDLEFTAARSQAEKGVEDYVRSVLGEERFAELQRSRNPAARAVNPVGTGAGAAQQLQVIPVPGQDHLLPPEHP